MQGTSYTAVHNLLAPLPTILGFSTSTKVSSLWEASQGPDACFRTEWCVSVRARLWSVRNFHLPLLLPTEKAQLRCEQHSEQAPEQKLSHQGRRAGERQCCEAAWPSQLALQHKAQPQLGSECLKLPLAVVTGTWKEQQPDWVHT